MLINESLRLFKSVLNGPFAPTGHMVQHPPYWMAKECGILHWDIENKGKLVGIPLCSNLLHSLAIQYGGFCTM